MQAGRKLAAILGELDSDSVRATDLSFDSQRGLEAGCLEAGWLLAALLRADLKKLTVALQALEAAALSLLIARAKLLAVL